jgi:hypothetical protein
MHASMLSRMRNHFRDTKFARMSSGTYCIIRDLGLVKGGKGMRHHEVLFTFSLQALGRSIARSLGHLARTAKRRAGPPKGAPPRFGTGAPSSAAPERVIPR